MDGISVVNLLKNIRFEIVDIELMAEYSFYIIYKFSENHMAQHFMQILVKDFADKVRKFDKFEDPTKKKKYTSKSNVKPQELFQGYQLEKSSIPSLKKDLIDSLSPELVVPPPKPKEKEIEDTKATFLERMMGRKEVRVYAKYRRPRNQR